MSLSNYICTHRSDIHSIFRKLGGWDIKINEYSLACKKGGLLITMQLVGPPIVVYSYGKSWISVHVDSDGKERIMGHEGNIEELQRRVDEMIK